MIDNGVQVLTCSNPNKKPAKIANFYRNLLGVINGSLRYSQRMP